MISYETLQKVNAIDGFENYLPHQCVEIDFVEPLAKGGNEEELLERAAAAVYEGLRRNKEFLKGFGIMAKSKFYQVGTYRVDHKGREFLLLDLDGKDADITPDAIKERLRNFKHIKIEYDFIEILSSLGVRCKRAPKTMDKKMKTDVLVEINGEFYGVSVFKSEVETALYKMRFTKPTLDKRLYFQTREKEIKTAEVKNWLEQVAEGRKKLFFNTKNKKWEAK